VRRVDGQGSTLDAGAPASQYRYVIILLGFCTVMVCVGFNRFAYTLIMPDMRRSLGLSYTDMGTISTVGFLAYVLSCMPGGAAAARFGMRRAIAGGLAIAGAGLWALAFAVGFWSAVAANVVVQIGSAGANMAAFALVTPWFPASQRGIATGAVMGGAGAGIALVGRLLPPILMARGWQGAWAVVAVMVLGVSTGCAILLRDHPAARPGSTRDAPVGARAWARLSGRGELWVVAAVMMLYGFTYIIFGTFFAVRLTTAGLTVAEAGEFWALVGILMIGSGLVGGALSDRVGRLRSLALLFAAQAGASALLALTVRVLGVGAAVVLYGSTVMGFPAVVGAFCADLVGAAQASAAIGLVNVFFALGQALGPLAGGWVIDVTGSVAVALIGGAVLAIVGGAGSLVAARWHAAKASV
jgi:MFS family permease